MVKDEVDILIFQVKKWRNRKRESQLTTCSRISKLIRSFTDAKRHAQDTTETFDALLWNSITSTTRRTHHSGQQNIDNGLWNVSIVHDWCMSEKPRTCHGRSMHTSKACHNLRETRTRREQVYVRTRSSTAMTEDDTPIIWCHERTDGWKWLPLVPRTRQGDQWKHSIRSHKVLYDWQ